MNRQSFIKSLGVLAASIFGTSNAFSAQVGKTIKPVFRYNPFEIQTLLQHSQLGLEYDFEAAGVTTWAQYQELERSLLEKINRLGWLVHVRLDGWILSAVAWKVLAKGSGDGKDKPYLPHRIVTPNYTKDAENGPNALLKLLQQIHTDIKDVKDDAFPLPAGSIPADVHLN